MDDRQTIGVVLTLHGAQDVAVVAHHPGTSAATVSVRLGRTLIYIYDRASAKVFATAWQRLGRDARHLPRVPGRYSSPPAAQVGQGRADAAVMVEARNAPAASGQLLRVAGRPPSLRVQVGRLVFDVRDAIAFATTHKAFTDALQLSETALPAPATDDAMRQFAFARAAAARPATRQNGARHPASSARSAPHPHPPPAPAPAPRLGRGWLQ